MEDFRRVIEGLSDLADGAAETQARVYRAKCCHQNRRSSTSIG